MPIDLDNNATTQPDPAVLAVVNEVAATTWGNPGSPHARGRAARRVLEEARERIAAALDAPVDGVVFTSGATESCRLAITGLARRPATLLRLPGDHPASRAATDELVAAGWRAAEFDLTPAGQLDAASLAEQPWNAITLATLPLAQNETGVLFDVAAVGERCREHGIAWHLDASQAVGRVPVSLRSLACSALTISGHKMHGPRGIAAVLLGEGVTLRSPHGGGHQEAGRRAGTEAVALAAGLAEAVTIATRTVDTNAAAMRALRDRFERELRAAVPGLTINAAASDRLPNTSSVQLPEGDGEAMLVALDLAGICCSLGSACASGSPEPAPVLLAMGLSPEAAGRSLRFSLSRSTTEADIVATVAAIARIASRTD